MRQSFKLQCQHPEVGHEVDTAAKAHSFANPSSYEYDRKA